MSDSGDSSTSKLTYEELEQRLEELERDVVTLRKLEQSLRESESLYRVVAHNVNDVIWTMDMNLRFTYVSPAVKHLRGFTPEEVMAQRVEDVLTPASVETALRAFEEEMAYERSNPGGRARPRVLEFEQYCKDGSTVWTEDKMVFLRDARGRPVGILGVTRDITARKRAEEEVKRHQEQLERLVEERTAELTRTVVRLKKEMEERRRTEHTLRLFRYAIEQSTEGVAVADLKGYLLFVNEAFAQMHGYSPGELIGEHLSVFHTPEQMPSVDAANREAIAKGAFIGLVGHARRDGTTFLGAMRNWAITDDRGNPVGIIGTLRDVTDREEVQRALRRSEQRYRMLYENLRDGSATVNLEGRIVECNTPFLEMLGYSQEEILALTYKEITPAKWHPVEEKILREQVMARGYSDVYEKEYIRKDGTIFPVELRTYLVRGDDGQPEGMWAIVRDITRRRLMEAEILKSQKLESLGILAGGIAHDLNNILTAILANLSILRMYANLEEDLAHILTEAERACGRARRLGEQLLTFAKGGSPIKKVLSLGGLLRDTTEFALAGSNIRCEYSMAEDLDAVEGDPTQISQVIHNLVLNAKQAMPEGGVIRLCAANATVGEQEATGLRAGSYVKISIEDRGEGIPAENLPRIFDPFFTTKRDGSGLGLATAYSIVKGHGGHIHVESDVGAGATFHVYLPAFEGDHCPARAKEPETRKGSGKVLVIDDEPTILRSAREILTRLGYEVECAREGAEGLRLYREAMARGRPFDTVILDLTIPGGMGGRETIRKLRDVDPKAKVIVSSGYSDDPVMAHYREYGFCAVLPKPYSLEELSETLHRVGAAPAP